MAKENGGETNCKDLKPVIDFHEQISHEVDEELAELETNRPGLIDPIEKQEDFAREAAAVRAKSEFTQRLGEVITELAQK